MTRVKTVIKMSLLNKLPTNPVAKQAVIKTGKGLIRIQGREFSTQLLNIFDHLDSPFKNLEVECQNHSPMYIVLYIYIYTIQKSYLILG